MPEMPDCPHCSADQTLEAYRVEMRGVKVCTCSCCGKECRVSAAGVIVHSGRDWTLPAA
jgi:hypothetical protein